MSRTIGPGACALPVTSATSSNMTPSAERNLTLIFIKEMPAAVAEFTVPAQNGEIDGESLLKRQEVISGPRFVPKRPTRSSRKSKARLVIRCCLNADEELRTSNIELRTSK